MTAFRGGRWALDVDARCHQSCQKTKGGGLPRAGAVPAVLPHELLPARVLDPASYVLPRLEVAWVAHGTHCCRGPLAREQLQICWVLSPVGRTIQTQEDSKIVSTIFDSDATDTHIVVDVAMAL